MSDGSPRDDVDSLPCQCQSFRRVSRKSAGDCMRNANKSPKIPYSAMVREWKSDQFSSSIYLPEIKTFIIITEYI